MEEDREYTFEGTVCGILLSGIEIEAANFLLNEIRDTIFLPTHVSFDCVMHDKATGLGGQQSGCCSEIGQPPRSIVSSTRQ